jgi:hypothetical protein
MRMRFCILFGLCVCLACSLPLLNVIRLGLCYNSVNANKLQRPCAYSLFELKILRLDIFCKWQGILKRIALKKLLRVMTQKKVNSASLSREFEILRPLFHECPSAVAQKRRQFLFQGLKPYSKVKICRLIALHK